LPVLVAWRSFLKASLIISSQTKKKQGRARGQETQGHGLLRPENLVSRQTPKLNLITVISNKQASNVDVQCRASSCGCLLGDSEWVVHAQVPVSLKVLSHQPTLSADKVIATIIVGW